MLTRIYRRPQGGNASEECFYVDVPTLSDVDFSRLAWIILAYGYGVSTASQYEEQEVVEIGPKLWFETAFSTAATASLRNMGVPVRRIERSIRIPIVGSRREKILLEHLDSMLQMVYPAPLTTFDSDISPEPLTYVNVLKHGAQALRDANACCMLGLDSSDLEYYAEFFRKLKRNPTDAELAFFANADSDHSRHHGFRGIREIDGLRKQHSLMDLIKKPWQVRPGNNLVAFHDNAGVIKGWRVPLLMPSNPGHPSVFKLRTELVHLTATAETHNHPTMFAPFPGAETGIGGRIRDNRAVGRGSLVHAGVAGYCVGSLEELRPKNSRPIRVPGIPFERIRIYQHATPVDVIVRGSSGVAHYGNEIGEPLIGGFAREFGQIVDGKYRAFVKPVLYSGGVGFLSDANLYKRPPKKGMLVVQIGGPTYRIGIGGGAASSASPEGNSDEMNRQSVQRGDAEKENATNRVIQSCAEMGKHNPIQSIHDQGAGGILNVLTELVAPAGAVLDFAKVVLGDRTLSDREIGSAESQERYGLLLWKKDLKRFKAICDRERVNCEVLGKITGDGKIVVRNSSRGTKPVDLPLKEVLEDRPRKLFADKHLPISLTPLVIPKNLGIARVLWETFWLLQVGSKEFKVRKTDTSVTGLVARGPRVGPLHIPLADCGVFAVSHFALRGLAEAIGENPNRLLINPAAGARMAAAEMFANMMGAKITRLSDIACRVNWMWPAKFPGEGAALWDAVEALSTFLQELRDAANGGKDSLSMSAIVEGETVLSPRQLVIFGYAPVPDVRTVVTPDFKGDGIIGLIDLSGGNRRLGGSAFAQALRQLGNDCPDIDARLLMRGLKVLQKLVGAGAISAYHDISDGGLISALAEMCIAGNRGAQIRLPHDADPFPELFCEEVRMVIEYPRKEAKSIEALMRQMHVPFSRIGMSGKDGSRDFVIERRSKELFAANVGELRRRWERKSDAIEARQSNPATLEEEKKTYGKARAIPYTLTFTPKKPTFSKMSRRPKVGIIREEGTNGDREMAAAFRHAGFNPVDIAMSDIRNGNVRSLHDLRGIAAAGGFSFADAFSSGRAWAGGIRFHPETKSVFEAFFKRDDTFSLGVCNGFQLMSLIGRPFADMPESSHPQLGHNRSGRFESRWSPVKVVLSPSIFTPGMEGSIFDIPTAHGEGKIDLPDPRVAEIIRKENLAPFVYVDTSGNPTEKYPYNPNNSPFGWAALCSPDGRHLGMMPHPERCVLTWQVSRVPERFRNHKASPTLQMFVNSWDWCRQH